MSEQLSGVPYACLNIFYASQTRHRFDDYSVTILYVDLSFGGGINELIAKIFICVYFQFVAECINTLVYAHSRSLSSSYVYYWPSMIISTLSNLSLVAV